LEIINDRKSGNQLKGKTSVSSVVDFEPARVGVFSEVEEAPDPDPAFTAESAIRGVVKIALRELHGRRSLPGFLAKE
jgi:hypothetical protein